MSMTDAELQTLENLGHGDAAEEIRELRAELTASEARADRLTRALDWISQKLVVKSWCGVIGAPSSWGIAGDYRHTTQQMKGATLLDAVEHAALAEGEVRP